MANADTPFGLRPIRHKSGAPYNGAVNPYFINSSYGTALFIGDAVIKTGTANTAVVSVPGGGDFPIASLPEINSATVGDGNRITGVIVAFAASPTALENVHNPASTERVAFVCDDPEAVFLIQADGAIPATSIGLNAVLIATHAGSSTTARSGMELDTTSDAPAADASNQLLILRQATVVGNVSNLVHNKIEVMINQHTELAGTVGTAGI